MAKGSDSGAAVNSCILDADNRRTPSGLLVFVLDRLRDFATSTTTTTAGSEGPESLDGSPSLWLSLEASGVGKPLVGLDTGFSGADCGLLAGFNCIRSVGVSSGEGRCVVVSEADSVSRSMSLAGVAAMLTGASPLSRASLFMALERSREEMRLNHCHHYDTGALGEAREWRELAKDNAGQRTLWRHGFPVGVTSTALQTCGLALQGWTPSKTLPHSAFPAGEPAPLASEERPLKNAQKLDTARQQRTMICLTSLHYLGVLVPDQHLGGNQP